VSMNKNDTTDQQAARANRRWMPPPKRVFKDKNRYDRKAEKRRDFE
jgi:hypothetical protein